MDVEEWRCRRHPAQPCGGVCPHCLRDRLLRLCPDCACTRPCPCPYPCAASTASSPSSSSSAASSGGALARVHSLIERSRSAAANEKQRRPKSGVWGWVSFRKPAATAGFRDVEAEAECYDDAVALARSRSVSAATTAVEVKGASKPGGWGRLVPWKIKALRHRKAIAR